MRRTSLERDRSVARVETSKPTAAGLVRIYKDAATRNDACTARLLVARSGLGRVTEVVHVIGGVKGLLHTGPSGCAARSASSTLVVIMSAPDQENSRNDNKEVFQRLFHTKLVSQSNEPRGEERHNGEKRRFT